MSGQKKLFILIGAMLSISFITSALAVIFTSHYYSQLQFELLNVICGEVLEQKQETENIISTTLKKYTSGNIEVLANKDILGALGYSVSDLANRTYSKIFLFAIGAFFIGTLLFIITFLYRNKMETLRIQALADYLEKVNTGNAVIFSAFGEDEFSKLEDEIYKTVTSLYHTRDAAVQVKNNYAENLSNIAHQLKTPITSISLSLQMMQKGISENHLEQVQKQLLRLAHLEESLLVLSRLDAGTLLLKKQEVDVFTVLVLAADNLQELCSEAGTFIDIPELGEMAVTVDLDWTMEAIMNLMKNCIEHNKGGTVRCFYEQNPLYVEITIWDEGEGFMKEDIPYLFERFYRGKNASESGIGIGLALSKEIVERQNGTIRAKNIVDAGACFEIRFYCH